MTAFSDTVCEISSGDSLYPEEKLVQLDPCKIPEHIAIIMDGNRRWAKDRDLPPMMGHWEGAEALTEVVQAASELGVKRLTVYSFSTENWQRSPEEVEALMNIFELYLVRKRELMIRDGVRLNAIGDLEKLPRSVQKALDETKMATKMGDKIELVLALNYGGRDEIRRTVVKILEDAENGLLSSDEVTEEYIASKLDTVGAKDPDLLIRTSGELRVSNFLLWQISYSEIVTTETLWPDFSSATLFEAIQEYQKRKRRLGE